MRRCLVPVAVVAAVVVGASEAPSARASGTPCGGPITIHASGPGSPYPSTCEITGRTGVITDVDISISRLFHTFPDRIDMLLVGPGGENAIIMSDAGGSLDLIDVDLRLDDAAPSPLPNAEQIVGGTYRPR